MSDVLFSWTVDSFTRRGVTYSVRLLDNGRMICSCPAFVNHPDEDCKHIRSVRKGAYDPDEVSVPVAASPVELEKTNVRNLGSSTETTKLFRYGGLWRVQWTKVSNDKANSRLLADHDAMYGSYASALETFRAFTE